MAVRADTDFLPWIMGALVAAIAGLALVIHAAPDHRPARSIEPVAAKAAPPQAAPSPAPAPSPVIAPTIAAAGPAVAAPMTPRTDLPPGQVYECTREGQRIFSDSPCGERAAIRQLSEVNRMAAVAVTPDPPGAHFVPPPQFPVRDANYALPPEAPPQTNESAPGGLLLYPVPVVPYRYHGGPGHENRPRNTPQTPQNHAVRDLGSAGR